MAKKAKDESQKPPAQGPAPSAEELRRQHIETNAKERLGFLLTDLEELRKGSFRKAESLRALEQAGVKVVELALQTRGRLRSADGRGDAFLEATAANVRTALRHADKVMEGHDREMTAWAEALEIASPAIEDLKRISKGLERPGIKVAIVPGGSDGLFDEEGQPTQAAAAPAQPAPDPAPAPASEPPAPAPEQLQARDLPALGMAEGPVIDVEPEPEWPEEPAAAPAAPAHPLDGKTTEQCDNAIVALLDRLEEAGVEEGLKRKDWKLAHGQWTGVLDEIWPVGNMDLSRAALCYDLVDHALNVRKPISWGVVTEKDLLDHQRKAAIADPTFDAAAGE